MPKETVAGYPIFHALVSYVMLHSHTPNSGRELLAEDEAKSPSEAAAEELRRVRMRKGWNQQQLADRLEELGTPIDQATISKIEKNRRRMTLDEVFAFAYALGVSPAALVLPRDSFSTVAITPTTEKTASETLDWLRGVLPLGVSDQAGERFFDEETLNDEALVLQHSPELFFIRHWAGQAVRFASHQDGDSLRAVLRRLEDDIKHAIRTAEHRRRKSMKRHPSRADEDSRPAKRTPAKRKPGKRKPAKRKVQR
jgi:transcriptional regulator with XRE-family HTH domain